MTLGDIVTVMFGTKAYKPHVVVGVRPDRIQLCYCGSERWYLPSWHKSEHVTSIDENKAGFLNPKAMRRCKRLLLAIKPSPDGWKRIDVGRYGSDHAPVIVGHVDVPWTWAE